MPCIHDQDPNDTAWWPDRRFSCSDAVLLRPNHLHYRNSNNFIAMIHIRVMSFSCVCALCLLTLCLFLWSRRICCADPARIPAPLAVLFWAFLRIRLLFLQAAVTEVSLCNCLQGAKGVWICVSANWLYARCMSFQWAVPVSGSNHFQKRWVFHNILVISKPGIYLRGWFSWGEIERERERARGNKGGWVKTTTTKQQKQNKPLYWRNLWILCSCWNILNLFSSSL